MVFNRTINSQTFIKIGDAYTPKLLAEWVLISDLIIQLNFVNYFNFPTYKHFLCEILFLIKQEAILIKCSNDNCIPICINIWRQTLERKKNIWTDKTSVCHPHLWTNKLAFPIKICKNEKQYYDKALLAYLLFNHCFWFKEIQLKSRSASMNILRYCVTWIKKYQFNEQ
jgi:hypothetical protein